MESTIMHTNEVTRNNAVFKAQSTDTIEFNDLKIWIDEDGSTLYNDHQKGIEDVTLGGPTATHEKVVPLENKQLYLRRENETVADFQIVHKDNDNFGIIEENQSPGIEIDDLLDFVDSDFKKEQETYSVSMFDELLIKQQLYQSQIPEPAESSTVDVSTLASISMSKMTNSPSVINVPLTPPLPTQTHVPALPQSSTIDDFTLVSLTIPERVKTRHKLDRKRKFYKEEILEEDNYDPDNSAPGGKRLKILTDDKYRELRDKNNAASKKSRLSKKQKEKAIFKEEEEEQKRNNQLTSLSKNLEEQVLQYRIVLFKCASQGN